VNLPWGDLVVGGRLRSAAEVRALASDRGIGTGTDVIASCGSGVSACLDLLALEAAGLPPGRLFVPSWSGWAADGARVAAMGAEPGGQ
jgi:thiosulfate/3-mercaptopyruvate sulfurtransferase